MRKLSLTKKKTSAHILMQFYVVMYFSYFCMYNEKWVYLTLTFDR